ncbi:hypothetical protein [Krasilnikovia sp. M28-CT-15]|uniref:hypothetical protein n=1 Tax=Krasilnikovia sp. M28-CT-15 TaxID=3373540 RepID=UPI003876C068
MPTHNNEDALTPSEREFLKLAGCGAEQKVARMSVDVDAGLTAIRQRQAATSSTCPRLVRTWLGERLSRIGGLRPSIRSLGFAFYRPLPSTVLPLVAALVVMLTASLAVVGVQLGLVGGAPNLTTPTPPPAATSRSTTAASSPDPAPTFPVTLKPSGHDGSPEVEPYVMNMDLIDHRSSVDLVVENGQSETHLLVAEFENRWQYLADIAPGRHTVSVDVSGAAPGTWVWFRVVYASPAAVHTWKANRGKWLRSLPEETQVVITPGPYQVH